MRLKYSDISTVSAWLLRKTLVALEVIHMRPAM